MADVLIRPHFDGDSMTLQHTQDVEPILERNKELRTMEQPSDWGRHVASIPNVIYVRWLDEAHARGHTGLAGRLMRGEADDPRRVRQVLDSVRDALLLRPEIVGREDGVDFGVALGAEVAHE